MCTCSLVRIFSPKKDELIAGCCLNATAQAFTTKSLNDILEAYGDLNLLNYDTEGTNDTFDNYRLMLGPVSMFYDKGKLIREEFPYGKYVVEPYWEVDGG